MQARASKKHTVIYGSDHRKGKARPSSLENANAASGNNNPKHSNRTSSRNEGRAMTNPTQNKLAKEYLNDSVTSSQESFGINAIGNLVSKHSRKIPIPRSPE